MATPGALQPQIRAIVANDGMLPGGIIPFRDTIFLWQSFVSVAVEILVVTTVMWLATPPPQRGKTAADLGIDLTDQAPPGRQLLVVTAQGFVQGRVAMDLSSGEVEQVTLTLHRALLGPSRQMPR